MCVGVVVGRPKSCPSSASTRASRAESREARPRHSNRNENRHNQQQEQQQQQQQQQQRESDGNPKRRRPAAADVVTLKKKTKKKKRPSAHRPGIEGPGDRTSGPPGPRSGQQQAEGAMAPALTQATPHQRCCPVGNGSSSPSGAPITLLHHPAVAPHHPNPRTRRHSGIAKKASPAVEKPVWSDDALKASSSSPPSEKRTRKCSGARSSLSATVTSERSNSYKTRLRHSSTSNNSASGQNHQEENHCASGSSNNSSSSNSSSSGRKEVETPLGRNTASPSVEGGKEIARLTQPDLDSNRDGDGGCSDEPADKRDEQVGTTLDPHRAVEEDRVQAAADPPPAPTGINGSASSEEEQSETMGLEPTASGDRMEIESPLPPLAVESGSPCKSSELADVAIDDDPAAVDAFLDVIKNMDVDHSIVADMDLTAAEQQLLHEAAAAAMEAPQQHQHLKRLLASPVATPTPIVDKEAEVERRLAEVRSKQQAIETRCQTLLKRAGRMQSRHVGRHVADEVAHFVAYAKETLSIGAKGRSGHHGANGANLYGWAEDGRMPTREEVRNIPTATLVNLVSRLQAPPVSYLSNRRYFGLSSRSSGQPGQHLNNHHHHQHHYQRPGPQLSSQMAENIEEVAGLWEAQLRYLQRHDDPDATESSSGGESDDETLDPVPVTPLEVVDPSGGLTSATNPSAGVVSSSTGAGAAAAGASAGQPTVRPISTYQRAAWRWARDRAAVAARWSWLQAQVSDLEYRIRQHTDVYRQLRAAKGAVHFAAPGGVATPSTSSSCSPSKSPAEADENAPEASSSSRTRPLVVNGASQGGGAASASAGAFRHRRLIRASQVQTSRKSSRHASSTVRCCCVMSRIYNPCVLCNGRNNYLLPVDPDGMTLRERVGLTDRGFHPVLSLGQDIPLGAHVDSLLKSGDWKPPPPAASSASSASSARTGMSSRRSSQKLAADDDAGSVASGHSMKRKGAPNGTNKRKKADDADSTGIKERRKSLTKRRRKHLPSTEPLDDDSQSYPSSPFGDGSCSVPTTPGRPGLSSRESFVKEMQRKRSSYDIDNIVIPYSMAAATRVERLQYKEIQTPKWRAVEASFPFSTIEVSSEESEDVSEEACQARHERSEVEERKKFMSYLKQPAGVTRGRRRVDQMDRMDSRADHSSGANTPDPMSPSCQLASGSKTADSEAIDGEESNTHSSGTATGPNESQLLEGPPPSTPTPVSALLAAAAAVKERRRTASLTKRDSISRFIHDDNSAMSWDVDELFRSVAPYEPRQFPLPDAIFQQLLDEMPASDGEEELIGGIVIEARPASKREARTSESAAAPPGVAGNSAAASLAAGATPTTTTSSVDDEPVAFMSESSGSPPPEDLDVDEDDPDWEASSQSSVTRTGAAAATTNAARPRR